jgi:hypothetical protein
LKNETRNIVRKTLSEKVFRRTNYLNQEKLSQLQQNQDSQQKIDKNAFEWLENNHAVNVNKILAKKNLSQATSMATEDSFYQPGRSSIRKMKIWMLASQISPKDIFDKSNPGKDHTGSRITLEQFEKNLNEMGFQVPHENKNNFYTLLDHA